MFLVLRGFWIEKVLCSRVREVLCREIFLLFFGKLKLKWRLGLLGGGLPCWGYFVVFNFFFNLCLGCFCVSVFSYFRNWIFSWVCFFEEWICFGWWIYCGTFLNSEFCVSLEIFIWMFLFWIFFWNIFVEVADIWKLKGNGWWMWNLFQILKKIWKEGCEELWRNCTYFLIVILMKCFWKFLNSYCLKKWIEWKLILRLGNIFWVCFQSLCGENSEYILYVCFHHSFWILNFRIIAFSWDILEKEFFDVFSGKWRFNIVWVFGVSSLLKSVLKEKRNG